MKWRHDYSKTEEELDRLEQERLPALKRAARIDASKPDDDLAEGVEFPDDPNGTLAIFIKRKR